MEYELRFKEDLNEADAALVHAYWAMENGAFVHNVNELAAAHGMTRIQLTALVKAFTTCELSLGHCAGCGDEVRHTVVNKTDFKRFAGSLGEPLCPDCQRAYAKRLRYEASLTAGQAVSALGQNAVRLKPWECLTPEELAVLKGIVRYKTKPLIYEHVFAGNNRNREVWALVKQLVRRGLVEVVWNYNDYIEEFCFQPELENHLFGAETAADATTSNHFNIKLLKNAAKKAPWQPDYSGAVTLRTDMFLPKGTRLAYGAWETNAKDLLVQLRPFETVRRYVRPEEVTSEPVSIQQVIERLFDSFADVRPA